MSDTTIRSHFGKKLTIGYRGDGEVQIECGPDHDNTGNHVRIYKLDEVKAALGIDELGCGCDEADDNLKAALADRDDWIARAEQHQHNRDLALKARNEAQDRAERAEAALARIEARVDASPSRWIKAQYAEAVREVPPFTLPTETGARFEARNDYRGTITFRTVLDGPGQHKYLYEGKDVLWTGESVMEELTDHRLIGAES